jgi:hypothetical protein
MLLCVIPFLINALFLTVDLVCSTITVLSILYPLCGIVPLQQTHGVVDMNKDIIKHPLAQYCILDSTTSFLER